MATKNLHLATIFLQLVAKRRPEDFFNFEPWGKGMGGRAWRHAFAAADLPSSNNLSYKCQHIKLFLHHGFFFGFIAALLLQNAA